MKKYILFVFVSFIISTAFTSLLAQSLALQPNATNGKDSRVFNLACGINAGLGCDTSNYGSDGFFQANAWTFSGNSAVGRSYLEFNLSNVSISSSSVSSAVLYLYFPPEQVTYESHSSISGSNMVYIDRVIQSWTENGIKWINQPNTVNANFSNPENRVTIPATSSSTQDFSIDITSMLKYWLTNPSQNFGIRLSLATEQYYRRMTFATSDHTNPLLRPKLVINYSTSNSITENLISVSNLNIKNSNNNLNFNTSVFGEFCEYQLISLDGKILLEHKFNNTTVNHNINTSNIPNGMYLLKVKDESNMTKCGKVIIHNL